MEASTTTDGNVGSTELSLDSTSSSQNSDGAIKDQTPFSTRDIITNSPIEHPVNTTNVTFFDQVDAIVKGKQKNMVYVGLGAGGVVMLIGLSVLCKRRGERDGARESESEQET